jgi:hypothetical protein
MGRFPHPPTTDTAVGRGRRCGKLDRGAYFRPATFRFAAGVLAAAFLTGAGAGATAGASLRGRPGLRLAGAAEVEVGTAGAARSTGFRYSPV